MGNRIQGLNEFKPEKGAFVGKREALHSMNRLYEKDKISLPKISSILTFDWNIRKRIR